MGKRILGLVLISVLAGAAVLLSVGQRVPSRESALPLLRVLQQHEKQADRAVGAVIRLSPEDERRIGAEIDASLGGGLSPGEDGEELETLVLQTGRSLSSAPLVRRFRGRYEFRVIWGVMVVNAFALPGGYIRVLEGLAVRFKRHPDALAAVLAHEIGHVELGHCADAHRTREWLQKAGLGPAGDLAGPLRALAELHFSEAQELEADEYSVRLLRSAGLDPRAALKAMDILAGPSSDEARRGPAEVLIEGLADYSETHPAGRERRARMRRAIDALPARAGVAGR
ncbi:MAG: M48 family metalloprotease [Elusimicrobiota bacterium]